MMMKSKVENLSSKREGKNEEKKERETSLLLI